MEEYIITIKATISVPQHTDALRVQNGLTQLVSDYVIDAIPPISKIEVFMKEQ